MDSKADKLWAQINRSIKAHAPHSDSILVVGDMRTNLLRDLQKVIEKTVYDQETKKDSYYLLVHAKKYGNSVKTTLLLRGKPFPRMLSTMCWHVNNRTGETKCLWILPQDKPVEHEIITDITNQTILESAQGMPIIYG